MTIIGLNSAAMEITYDRSVYLAASDSRYQRNQNFELPLLKSPSYEAALQSLMTCVSIFIRAISIRRTVPGDFL